MRSETGNPLNGISDEEKKILKYCSEKWFKNAVGISAIHIAEDFSIPHTKIMKVIEGLVERGLGKINQNVELYCLKFDIEEPEDNLVGEKIITHIFFPSKDILKYYFHKSKLSKEDIPEYAKRLHLGGNQVGLSFFKEEVLRKYYDHPELYDIDDSMSGGSICINGTCEENEYIHVRYGKKLINNGYTAITAILKDLADMSTNEQKYWSSFEIKECILDKDDENFKRFLDRNYEGEWGEYNDPIKDISRILSDYNKVFCKPVIYAHTENIHLRPPVENTEKELCNSCSELYKLIGPDNINQKSLKDLMIRILHYSESDFVHSKSKKELSSLQLLKLLEKVVTSGTVLCDHIEIIKGYRINADHKILGKDSNIEKYSSMFYDLCKEYVNYAGFLLQRIKNWEKSDC